MANNQFDQILAQARKNAGDIQKLSLKLGIDLSEVVPTEIKQLNDCLDTYSASKVLIATLVEDASGEITLEKAARLAANFDKNWDKFAAEYNSIFARLGNTEQANVLETFAKTHFGDRIFEAGSVIKNDTPVILGGIVEFKSGIDSFKGNFRDPKVAVEKIKTGVNHIVNSTKAIANSLNNMLKVVQGGSANGAKGSEILSKLTKLDSFKLIAAPVTAINAAHSAMVTHTTFAGAIQSLKQGDVKSAYTLGKATVDNVKSTIQGIRDAVKNGHAYMSTATVPGSKQKPGSNNNNTSSDSRESTGPADSYVCSKAKIKCSKGDKISILTVLPSRTIWLHGQPQANISDHISMVNISPCGKCHTTAYPPTGAATAANHGKLTPMPCVPNTPYPWMKGKNDVLLKGDPALLTTSQLKCIYGGTITITFSGQEV